MGALMLRLIKINLTQHLELLGRGPNYCNNGREVLITLRDSVPRGVEIGMILIGE